MKNLNKFKLVSLVVIVTTCLFFTSCEKDESENAGSTESTPFMAGLFKSSIDADARAYIQGVVNDGNLSMFVLQGSFDNDQGVPVGNVSFSVNDFEVAATGPSSGTHYGALGYNSQPFTDLLSLEGDTLGVKVSNYILGNFNAQSYFPDIIRMDPISDNHDMDRSEGLTITWNQESNREGKVGVMMLYRGYHSNQLDSINPVDGQFQIVELLSGDDGTFTIPSEKLLATFPRNSYVHLYLFRGNSTVVRSDLGNEMEIVNYSFDSTTLIFTD